MRHLPTVLFSLTCVLSSHVSFAHVHTRHVRSVDRLAQMLLELGGSGSALFRSLVGSIEASDVIVYVQTVDALPHPMDGRLQFSAAVKGARYLRISIRRDLSIDRLVALVGHELMHAVEIAGDQEVIDQASLRALYLRIGHSRDRAAFDSGAAIAAGYRVLAELSAGRSERRITGRSGSLRR